MLLSTKRVHRGLFWCIGHDDIGDALPYQTEKLSSLSLVPPQVAVATRGGLQLVPGVGCVHTFLYLFRIRGGLRRIMSIRG